jgi:hypothetical protein
MGPCGAPRPAHRERGGVRWLGTNGAAQNRGGAAVTAYQREAAVGARTKLTGGSSFIAASTGTDGTTRGGG